MNRSSVLANAVDIHRWLEADQVTPMAERDQRDRNIGRQQGSMDEISRILNWWNQVKPVTLVSPTGLQVGSIRRWLSVCLFVAGVFAGGSMCSVALAYRGDYPVNLLALVGVLVGIPGILLLLTALTSLMQGVGLHMPSSVVSTFNINRWLIGLWDRLGGVRFATAFGQANAQGGFVYWQLVTFSQWFGSGFFAGVLCIFGVLVTVTDLSFGWSTTLQIQAASVHQWTAIIAWPWMNWWPGAVPDMVLVEASRFNRLAGVVAEARAGQLGDWWRFVLMTIVVWGSLPRLLMLIIGQWRLAVATRHLLREHSEVTALLDRLTTPGVEHVGVGVAENRGESSYVPVAAGVEMSGAAVIVWNEAPAPESQGGPVVDVIALSTLDADDQRRRSLRGLIGGLIDGTAKLVIYTKGWEPPVLEFNDLIALIRAELGQQLPIAVAPLGVSGQPANETDWAIWSRAMARLGDPRLYVADGFSVRGQA